MTWCWFEYTSWSSLPVISSHQGFVSTIAIILTLVHKKKKSPPPFPTSGQGFRLAPLEVVTMSNSSRNMSSTKGSESASSDLHKPKAWTPHWHRPGAWMGTTAYRSDSHPSPLHSHPIWPVQLFHPMFHHQFCIQQHQRRWILAPSVRFIWDHRHRRVPFVQCVESNCFHSTAGHQSNPPLLHS